MLRNAGRTVEKMTSGMYSGIHTHKCMCIMYVYIHICIYVCVCDIHIYIHSGITYGEPEIHKSKTTADDAGGR